MLVQINTTTTTTTTTNDYHLQLFITIACSNAVDLASRQSVCYDIITELLKADADPNIAESNGVTPLTVSCNYQTL